MSFVAAESYLYGSECGVSAATALLVFDYCLTIKNEVELVFGTKWTPARIHFTSLRYLPFVALTLAIPSSRVVPPSETSFCGPLGTATNGVYYLCMALAEAMLVVRTYAFWSGDKKILTGICVFAVICCLTIAIVPLRTLDGQPTNSVYEALGCSGPQGPLSLTLQYTSLVVYETGMLSLNWIAFWRMKKQNNPGPLSTTLYRDGMMYMAIILVFSVINAIIIQYSGTPNAPQMVLHSILASRIFFNLRETSRQEQEHPLPMTLSEFHAAPRTVSDIHFDDSIGNSSSSGGIRIEVTRESVTHADLNA